MTYPDSMQESLANLEMSRETRAQTRVERPGVAESLELVRGYHPDYVTGATRELRVGPDKGLLVPHALADVLEGRPLVDPASLDLSRVVHDVDVLVIGAGGAGSFAALYAHQADAEVLLATKLRYGDSNTIMAEGGVAAASSHGDSPARHYLDTVGGGKFSNVAELAKALVVDAPAVVSRLEALGVLFDRVPEGGHRISLTGGHSRARIHGCMDLSGLEIMRVLRSELHSRHIDILEYRPAIELVLDHQGHCAGAVVKNLDTGDQSLIRAKAVVLATGGLGRLHPQGFPTTNHYGATADGLATAYRAGARLLDADSIQYHPTGVAWPEPLFGWLISELVRGYGAHLVNVDGDRFVNELSSRDVVASAVIRESHERSKGVKAPSGRTGVWLDTPMVELLHGEGTVQRAFAGSFRRFLEHEIDIRSEPVLVYPSQHYHNGGLMIDSRARTTVPNLYAAGEVTGGVHGRNRLGGNSLTDIFVFGRRAGINAAERAKDVRSGELTLQHVVDHQAEIGALSDGIGSPILVPHYASRWLSQRRS